MWHPTLLCKILPLLTKGSKKYNILKVHKLIKPQKQHKSLKKLLTNGKLYKSTTKNTVKNVNPKTVEYTPSQLEGSDFNFKQRKRFTIKTNFTCASESLIHIISCASCEHQNEYDIETENHST